jgi:AcrR family transcriptional regulator
MSVSLIAARTDTPQDARQVRSRNALCGAMLELLQETSFDQITIREISARAGTGYATFFRHYPTKEALLGDIASDEIGTLMAMTASMMTGQDRFGSILDLCNYVDSHRKLWAALLTGGAAGIVREELMRQAESIGDESQCPDWHRRFLGDRRAGLVARAERALRARPDCDHTRTAGDRPDHGQAGGRARTHLERTCDG